MYLLVGGLQDGVQRSRIGCGRSLYDKVPTSPGVAHIGDITVKADGCSARPPWVSSVMTPVVPASSWQVAGRNGLEPGRNRPTGTHWDNFWGQEGGLGASRPRRMSLHVPPHVSCKARWQGWWEQPWQGVVYWAPFDDLAAWAPVSAYRVYLGEPTCAEDLGR